MLKRLLAVICIFILMLPYVGTLTGPVLQTVEAQSGDLSEDQRTQLEAELRVLEKEIAEKEALLSKQKGQTGSIQNDLNILINDI